MHRENHAEKHGQVDEDDFIIRNDEAEMTRQESPRWDEGDRCVWFATSVNAYDIPDALDWQQDFRKALTTHEPDFFTTPEIRRQISPDDSFATPRRTVRIAPKELDFELKELDLGTSYASTVETTHNKENLDQGQRAQSPMTPKRRVPLRRHFSSPKTPPLFRAASPETRSLRATHTKALQSMPKKAGISAVVQGREVAFFRFGGELYAVGARCPHQGGILCEGEVGDIEDLRYNGDADSECSKRAYITCPVHKMQFDLRSGSVIDGSCAPLPTYRVRVVEVDESRKYASVEVGFDSIADTYFGEVDF